MRVKEKRDKKLGKTLGGLVKVHLRAKIMALLQVSPSTLDRWISSGVPFSKKEFVTKMLTKEQK